MKKIKLYQFPPVNQLPNFSTFCMKLENYLRLAKIPYENVYVRDPSKSPKKKLPYIIDGDQTIADTTLIIDYLQQQFPDHPDKDLTEAQRQQTFLLNAMLGEYLYWAIVYANWQDPVGFARLNETVFARLKGWKKWLFPKLVRRHVLKELYYQGYGRHAADVVYDFGKHAIDCLAFQLADKPYLLGDKPTSVDASAFAFIANMVHPIYQSPLYQCIHQKKNLLDYDKRMMNLLYPERVKEHEK